MSESWSATENVECAPRAEVRLVEFDPESEVKVLAGILFQQDHGTWDQAFQHARSMNEQARRKAFDAYVPARKAAGTKLAVRSRTRTCVLRS